MPESSGELSQAQVLIGRAGALSIGGIASGSAVLARGLARSRHVYVMDFVPGSRLSTRRSRKFNSTPSLVLAFLGAAEAGASYKACPAPYRVFTELCTSLIVTQSWEVGGGA